MTSSLDSSALVGTVPSRPVSLAHARPAPSGNVRSAPQQNPRPEPPASLLTAFMRYERALMTNDVPVLDELFADSPHTVRSDGGRAIVGFEHIAAFRAGRPTPPARWLEQVSVTMHSAALATVVAQSVRADGGRGVQTQVWQLRDGLWHVITAHVSTAPREQCAQVDPVDPRIWRVHGDSAEPGFPTAAGLTDSGSTAAGSAAAGSAVAGSSAAGSSAAVPENLLPLTGTTFAVKDLFAIAGHKIGGGNPMWLASAPVESESAPAVSALVSAGAGIAGIAHTDELAFSLAGTNLHYGTPPNAAALGRITGGSTSGPAAAVAAGLADFGLGTDTAGSIRVPSSYCGLYGLRTTHCVVSREGLVGLAESFDTVGIVASTAHLLAAANNVLLPEQDITPINRLVTFQIFDDLVTPDVQLAFAAGSLALSLRMSIPLESLAPNESFSRVELESWFEAFRTAQAAQAWREHGEFIDREGVFTDPAVAHRFRNGATISSEIEAAAWRTIAEATERITALLPAGTVLLLPSTAGPAPHIEATEQDIEASRAATLRLTCLASLAGLPALSVPALHVSGLPLGLCLVAAPHHDRSLLNFITAPEFGPQTGTQQPTSATAKDSQ